MGITWKGPTRNVAVMACDTPGCAARIERAETDTEQDGSTVHALCEQAHVAGWGVPNNPAGFDACPAHHTKKAGVS